VEEHKYKALLEGARDKAASSQAARLAEAARQEEIRGKQQVGRGMQQAAGGSRDGAAVGREGCGLFGAKKGGPHLTAGGSSGSSLHGGRERERGRGRAE